MNNSAMEQIGCDVICKSHSARTERDLYRICPSKLSKRELEDLYFALLENNLDLKKTINVQQDKIKVLSTRLQRMTVAQKNGAAKEKDCCASKAVVSEQRESLTDLKKTNERMAERIRLLNMRLCSAKQFLKRSPLQSTTSNKICTRCSFKNSSMSALNAKRSDLNIRTTAVSCQSLDNDVAEKPTRTVETETETEKAEKEDLQPCNENKCRTIMDELKEKIVNLQEELAISHNEYSERMAKLESQVLQLNDENLRVRSERVASEHALQERVKKADLLQNKLRNADAKCNELNMELSIEKRKVTELETGLKLANMSKHVVDTIEQLTAEKEDKQEHSISELARSRSYCSEMSEKEKAQLKLPSTSKINEEVKISISEDSGYTELNKSCETEGDQVMVKMTQELLQKIADLQMQLDNLRVSTAGGTESIQSNNPIKSESYDIELKDVINEKQTQNVAERGSTLSNLITEKSIINTPQTELERDKDVSPETEDRTSTVEPWEDYLITGRSANVDNIDHKDSDNLDEPIESSTIKHKSEIRVIRDDEHNSFQIPGPIPVVCPTQNMSKEKKKGLKSQNSKDSYSERLRNKKANSEEKTVKIFENSKDSYFNSEKQNGSNTKVGKLKDSTVMANLKEYVRDIEAERKTKDISEKKQKSVIITDAEAKLADRTPTRDSIFVNRKKLASQTDSPAMAEVKKESMTSFYLDSVCTPPHSVTPLEEATQVEQNIENDDDFGTQMDPPQLANRRDSATYTADVPNTYTVEVEKRSRATSPENTEHEISSLTDLPSEKDAKSPRAELSPGEEKATMTYTDTETETMPTDYGSLSEGEMPAVRKDRKVSIGETPSYLNRISIPVVTSSEKMEATLQSISEELARCRQLLLSQRPQEKDSSQWSRSSATEEVAVHALRHTAANSSIADTHTPSCVFTLHIGTLVLSDESVLYTRDKAIILMWKFYSQNAAMTRVNAGRVVQFDFVTEYDLTMNEDFLDYMKHSNMAIVLCEVEKQGEPFAMCSLPLREALLHANRRADMSLALIPTASYRVNGGDEIGVLDLWCSLRVDASALPNIYRVMHTSSALNWNNINPLRRDSKITQRVTDDDEISSGRISRDLDLNVKQGPATQSQSAMTGSRNFNPTTDNEYQAGIVRDPSSRYDDEVLQYRSSRPYRRSSQAPKSNPDSGPLRVEASGFIVNEVPATIRSAEDMKKALDRNVQQNNVTTLPKMDDGHTEMLQDASHIHSSIGYVKSLAARHQLSKLRSSKHKASKERVDSLQELLKKEKGPSIASTEPPVVSAEGYVKDVDSNETMSKIHNISKYIGVPGINKLVEASKKSVKYTDAPREEPQKESSAESDESSVQSIDITILWLALNEECEAMVNAKIQRLYVAYSFLGRRGADLETPFSLPKPKHYAEKCFFNFKKTFHLHECDLPLLGHMSRCRAGGGASTDPRDCIVFTLVSEPPEDPLGLSSCEDVGYAYLYLGDVLAYSGGSGGYTEVLGVRGVHGGVCGVLAVRVDQLPVLRRCLSLSPARRDQREDPSPSRLLPMFEIE